VSAGESCKRGSVTTSFMGFGKYFFASSEKRFASFLNVSQSDRLSHGVAMAGLNGWINGCMSVLLISYFSYHVAAGRTMSEYNPVPCMRKSILTNRSSFPAGVSPEFSISETDKFSGSPPNGWPCVPNKYFKKYSCPFDELPIKLALQT